MAPDDAEPDEDDAGDAGDDGSLEDLLELVAGALSTGQPLDVLGLASATLAIVLHPRPPVDLAREVVRERVLEDLVVRYVGLATPEALVYATAVAGLVADDTLRRRLRAALDGADADVPTWLARLDEAHLEQTTVVRDLFDDDEWLLGGVRLADGSRFAFRVEVDHNADGALGDAMLMPSTVDEITHRLRATSPADEVAIVELTPTDFWARYTEAAALADHAEEPPRTDTWPSCRPLVEWALHRAPGDRRTAG